MDCLAIIGKMAETMEELEANDRAFTKLYRPMRAAEKLLDVLLNPDKEISEGEYDE